MSCVHVGIVRRAPSFLFCFQFRGVCSQEHSYVLGVRIGCPRPEIVAAQAQDSKERKNDRLGEWGRLSDELFLFFIGYHVPGPFIQSLGWRLGFWGNLTKFIVSKDHTKL